MAIPSVRLDKNRAQWSSRRATSTRPCESLKEIEYDELAETEGGALVLSGTGTGKKSGVAVVFASAIFQSGPERFAAIAFIVDADIEKFYEQTALAICESVRVEADFAEETPNQD